jgi:predicted ABC-type ATPase
MNDLSRFDRLPIVIAIAGPNGAGKTTFYHSHVAPAGLRFVNADILAHELSVPPYDAARLAGELRKVLVAKQESFAFETVFSDPVGEKVGFLEETARNGFEVVLCFVGISGPEQSIERVAMRVSQGGHDVPDEKLRARYPRTMQNLREACARLPHVLIYDNSDLRTPYRHVATFENGAPTHLAEAVPEWLRAIVAES